MIVVDTNVVVNLLVVGPTSQMAEDVRLKDPEWSAPKLWRSEMRNVLMLYFRNGTFDLSAIQTHMNHAERLFAKSEFDVESSRVLELASISSCSAYDCEFVYLAERLSVKLVTSDKKLLSSFPKIAVSMQDFLST